MEPRHVYTENGWLNQMDWYKRWWDWRAPDKEDIRCLYRDIRTLNGPWSFSKETQLSASTCRPSSCNSVAASLKAFNVVIMLSAVTAAWAVARNIARLPRKRIMMLVTLKDWAIGACGKR